MLLSCIIEHLMHVADVVGDHYYFGKKAIRTGIGGKTNEIDGSRQYAVCTKERNEVIAQPAWCSCRHGIGRAVTLGRARRRQDGSDIGREQCHRKIVEAVSLAYSTEIIRLRRTMERPSTPFEGVSEVHPSLLRASRNRKNRYHVRGVTETLAKESLGSSER